MARRGEALAVLYSLDGAEYEMVCQGFFPLGAAEQVGLMFACPRGVVSFACPRMRIRRPRRVQ